MKKLVFLIYTGILFSGLAAQTGTYFAVSKMDDIPWERYELYTKRFVIAGEAHNVSCIYPFQLSQIRFLASRGFRHLVWEVPYSFSLIAQQYLNTGDTALMKFFVHTIEAREYWKQVYKINQSMPENDKLHIWGVDHELGDNLGGQYRITLFKKALELLALEKGKPPSELDSLYISLKTATTVAAVTAIKDKMQQLQNDEATISFFGKELLDFKILVNRLAYYKVSRNDEMLAAFKEICSLYRLDSSQKFLGRFGWGHINRSYQKSLSWHLENNPASPVKGSTFVIGVQYINCYATARNHGFLKNDGIVYDRQQKKELASLNNQDSAAIKVFTWPAEEKKKGWAKAADLLFVFSGFPGVTLLSGTN